MCNLGAQEDTFDGFEYREFNPEVDVTTLEGNDIMLQLTGDDMDV